jgi:hypothetical protein
MKAVIAETDVISSSSERIKENKTKQIKDESEGDFVKYMHTVPNALISFPSPPLQSPL